jgi:hypothetical protein
VQCCWYIENIHAQLDSVARYGLVLYRQILSKKCHYIWYICRLYSNIISGNTLVQCMAIDSAAGGESACIARQCCQVWLSAIYTKIVQKVSLRLIYLSNILQHLVTPWCSAWLSTVLLVENLGTMSCVFQTKTSDRNELTGWQESKTFPELA